MDRRVQAGHDRGSYIRLCRPLGPGGGRYERLAHIHPDYWSNCSRCRVCNHPSTRQDRASLTDVLCEPVGREAVRHAQAAARLCPGGSRAWGWRRPRPSRLRRVRMRMSRPGRPVGRRCGRCQAGSPRGVGGTASRLPANLHNETGRQPARRLYRPPTVAPRDMAACPASSAARACVSTTAHRTCRSLGSCRTARRRSPRRSPAPNPCG